MQAFQDVVWITFTVIGLIMIFVIFRSMKYGYPLTGKPTISRFFFYTSKLAFFLNWMLFLLKAIKPHAGLFKVPELLSWTGAILLVLGSVLFIPAVLQLGSSLRYGIPVEETRLKTNGIFSISRNPLYLGVFIICAGSCIYFPQPANILLFLYTFIFHLRIIKKEEEFLSGRFGDEWSAYAGRVRRML